MPGSTFKMVTTGIGLQNGVLDLQTTFPDESSWCRRRPTTRSRTTAARRAAAISPRCSRAAATSRSPRSPSSSARRRWSTGSREWGVGEPLPIDLPRPAASTFGDTTDLDQNLPLLAIRGFGRQRGADGPAAHGDGRRDGGQRGRDDGAVRGRQHLDHAGRVLDRTEPEVWKTPIAPADREHAEHV